MLDPITANNPNLERVPDGEENPYKCPDGWYRTKGHPKSRIAGSARVCDSAQVYDSARVCDSAQVYDSALVCDSALVYGSAHVYGSARVCGSALVCGSAQVCDSALVGPAVYAFAIKWPASLCAKGIVNVGCQKHPVKEWLKSGKSAIPWEAHCTKAERKIITDIIRTMAATEKLGKTWAKDSK